jgi:signal transduction histidine kinase
MAPPDSQNVLDRWLCYNRVKPVRFTGETAMALTSDALSVQAEERGERLHALYELALEIAELHDLQQVLDTTLKHCLELTGSQFGFIGLNTTDNCALDVVAIQGFEATPYFYEHFHVIPLRPSVFSNAVLENRPTRSDDATVDPRRIGQPRGHPPVRAFLGVPLRSLGVPVGMIGVANRPGVYGDDHEHLLMTYASQVAIAIRNAKLYEELSAAKQDLERQVAVRTEELRQAQESLAQHARQLQLLLAETVTAQERERARIAHNMHDGANQLIFGALLEVKAAQQRLAQGNNERVGAALERVRAVLKEVDGEIKRVIYHLRPPTLDALGLPAALSRYAERYQVFARLPCSLEVIGAPRRLDPEMEIGIYRVAQEALQNASVHAKASKAHVTLTYAAEAFQLSVSDDGVGFEPEHGIGQRDGRLGVLGMHERAQHLGGVLTIYSKPGRGTRVVLHLPTARRSETAPEQVEESGDGTRVAFNSNTRR